jgi:hypothetical protein
MIRFVGLGINNVSVIVRHDGYRNIRNQDKQCCVHSYRSGNTEEYYSYNNDSGETNGCWIAKGMSRLSVNSKLHNMTTWVSHWSEF